MMNSTDRILNDIIEIIRKDPDYYNQNETPTKNNNNNVDVDESLCPEVMKELQESEVDFNVQDYFSVSGCSCVSPMNNEEERCDSLPEVVVKHEFRTNNEVSGDDEQSNVCGIKKEDSENELKDIAGDSSIWTVQKRRRRSTKLEMRNMSPEERLERDKLGARKNTKKYNDRKKNEMETLKKELQNSQANLDETIAITKNAENKITSVLEELENMYSETNDLRTEFEVRKQQNNENLSNIMNSHELKELKKKLSEAMKAYRDAEGDRTLKRKNANTYGSKKCRAKKKIDYVEAEFQLKKTELKQEAYSKYLQNLNLVKVKIQSHIDVVQNQFEMMDVSDLINSA